MNEKGLSDLTILCLSKYIGEKCSICGREYKNTDILVDSNPVCSKNDNGILEFACKICFDTTKDTPIADRTKKAFTEDDALCEDKNENDSDICKNCGEIESMHILGKMYDGVIPKWCDDKENSLKFAFSQKTEVKK